MASATDGARASRAATTESRAAAPTGSTGRTRRGPLRPEVWLNTRQRAAARRRVFYFRGVDIVASSFLCVVAIERLAPGGLMQVGLFQALPILLGALVTLGLMRSLGLYRFDSSRAPARHLAGVAVVAALGGAIACALGLVLPGETPVAEYGWWAIASTVVVTGLHTIWRMLVAQWRSRGDLTPNVVVVGATRHAESLIREALDRRDLNILGVFDDRLARTPDALAGVPVLGGADALLDHRLTPYIDRVILAIDPKAEARVRALTRRLEVLPIPLTLLVDPKGAAQRNEALEKLASASLPLLGGAMDGERRAFNKRILDIILSALALVTLGPVLFLIGLAVRLDSKGPALFRQRRHGFNQEEIVVWKFRTMRQEASDATASRQVTADDDRVTRLGKFLRATSLDELPQLVNVLRGEMSLVGPRPHAIGMKTGDAESARLVAEYAHRHRIKPGMTGWAAIKGSRGPLHTADEVRRRVQLDIEYIERQSFWLDLWIIAVTVPVLLGDRMAVR
ncbi:UDP-phosphate glucose phosphotransferase [Brevundimonas naejangsanensis]|uniref:UDP-phosphate glucose phosphotransferase n=1 Tax=Brevundimonas naejangsanensis TaxID=588932 RepID=A0A172Y9E9_9CAUL|nr:UDP-phosphate glucose phosphotransferase [Brevundimonas naejangsanensis]